MKRIILIMMLSTMVYFTGCREKAPSRLPSFDLLLIDSTTIFNSGSIPADSPAVIMYFSPDCVHCKEETKEIIDNIDRLNNIQFYFLTPMPFNGMKAFYDTYKLGDYKNITVGKDYKLSFYKQFKPKATPYTVVYNKQKKLVKVYKKLVKTNDLIEVLN